MKRFYSVIYVLLLFCSCSNTNEDRINNNSGNSHSNKVEYNKALTIVKKFAEEVNSTKSRSFNFADLKIEKVNKSSLVIKFAESFPIVTKSTEIILKESIDIFTFEFEKDGTKGFAIATDDSRSPRILAYVENGVLADTIKNSAPAFMIRNIKNTIINDLNRYYGEKFNNNIITKAPVYLEWQLLPCIKTQWDFDAPYNNNYHTPSGANCTSTQNGKYPASYTAICLAQCISNYSTEFILPTNLTNKYNVRVFASTPKLTTNSPHATKVAQFIREFDDTQTTGGYTKFSCSGTGSQTELRYANQGFTKIGLGSEYYRYSGSSTKLNDIMKYTLKGLQYDCASVFGGYNSNLSKYNVWIVDGLHGPIANDYSDFSRAMAHICFTAGGAYNGWYTSAFTPQNQYGGYILGEDFSYFVEAIHIKPVCPWCIADY